MRIVVGCVVPEHMFVSTCATLPTQLMGVKEATRHVYNSAYV